MAPTGSTAASPGARNPGRGTDRADRRPASAAIRLKDPHGHRASRLALVPVAERDRAPLTRYGQKLEQVDGHDVQRWLVHLLTQYSDAYASNQYRALQQFFRWLAEEEQIPNPMARLRAPKVTEKLVPVFTSGELSALERTCQGRTFAQRRDAAVIAVLKASGISGRRAGRDPL
jgi:integrase